MADFFQGAAMPDVKTTQSTSTTAPDWYSNFLSGLATTGEKAVTQGGVADFSALQNRAFAAAPNAVNAGQGALTQAQTLAGESADPATSMISNYMNPYTQSVINEIGRLGQQNWQQTLAPGATAGAVGSGQFGSRRGMEVYGNLARDVNRDILGKQSVALSSGFDNALKSAQAQQQAQNQAAQTLGKLGGQQYEQGTGGLSVLSGLGAQQQALEQQRLNYPMTAAANVANLLRGFQVPTSTTQTYTGPMPGAYQQSPAALLGGMVSGGAGTLASISQLLKPYQTSGGAQSTPWADLLAGLKNMIPSGNSSGQTVNSENSFDTGEMQNILGIPDSNEYYGDYSDINLGDE